MNNSILYLSYDGMTDPLGQSQVIPYLAGLSAKGHEITLLSFEKPGPFERNGSHIAGILREAGIEWVHIKYHKSPPVLSAMYDTRAMYRRAADLASTGRYSIVHCRSYLPAMAGLRLKRRFGLRFLFDMRGFWADERVDGKTWNLSNPVYRTVYRYFKKKEKTLLREADHIVSLTHAGEKAIRQWFPGSHLDISVIPCCCDLSLFDPASVPASKREALRTKLGIGPAPVLSYLGALGTFYMLDEMLEFFREFRDAFPGAKFLFVTLHDRDDILAHARKQGIPEEDLVITAAARTEVPALLSLSQFSIFFITPLFSKSASSPTKQAEVMAMGIPVICNGNVGDTESIVSGNRCGAVVSKFNTEDYRAAIAALQATGFDPAEIRATAWREFSLDKGVDTYHRIYDSLKAGRGS